MKARPYIRKPTGAKEEKVLVINTLTHGMNNVSPEAVLNDNEAVDTKNMMFVSNSVMEKRYGTSIYDEDLVDLEKKIVWLDEYRPVSILPSLIRATLTDVYINNNHLCSVDGRITGVNYIGKYYFVDGKSLFVYDGITHYKIINDPRINTTNNVSVNSKDIYYSTPLPEIAAPGVTVHIMYPSANTQTTSIASIDTTLDKIVLTDGVTEAITASTEVPFTILFYIPKDTNSPVGDWVWNSTDNLAYYLPCMNELKDSFAGVGYIPPNPNVITVHKDRLFISGDVEAPHNFYLSALTNPLYFPSGAQLGVEPDGSKIIDMFVFDSSLIICRNRDMYVLYGNSERLDISDEPFRIKKMDISTGLMNRGCGALINNYYIFLGYDGRFYRLNTPTTFVEYLMTRPLEHKISLTKSPFNIQRSGLNCIAVQYYNEVWFHLKDDLILIYSFDNQSWTYYEGIKSSCLYTNGLDMLFGRIDGKVTKYARTGNLYNDLEKPINAVYETKRFDFGASASFKYFKRFMVTSTAFETNESNINVDVELDGYYLEKLFEIKSNLSRFGVSEWGSKFNTMPLHKSPWYDTDMKSRTIKFKFSNNNKDEAMRIFSVDICYSMRDVR